MPLDALARLATLGAPVAGLLDIAPFARLRDAIAAPAAARRGNVTRGRLQPLSERDTTSRARSAMAGTTPSSLEAAPGLAVPTGTRAAFAGPTDVLSPTPQALARQPSSTATLAERRAALRRAGAAPPPRLRSTAPESERETQARNGASTPASDAREIGLRHAGQRHDRTGNEVHHEEPTTSQAAPVLRQLARDLPPIDGPVTSEGESEAVPRLGGLASIEQTGGGSEAQSTGRRSPANPEAEAASGAASRRFAALSPGVTSTTPQADANPVRRQRASERTSGVDLADALFETLYRDGVDLSWP